MSKLIGLLHFGVDQQDAWCVLQRQDVTTPIAVAIGSLIPPGGAKPRTRSKQYLAWRAAVKNGGKLRNPIVDAARAVAKAEASAHPDKYLVSALTQMAQMLEGQRVVKDNLLLSAAFVMLGRPIWDRMADWFGRGQSLGKNTVSYLLKTYGWKKSARRPSSSTLAREVLSAARGRADVLAQYKTPVFVQLMLMIGNRIRLWGKK